MKTSKQIPLWLTIDVLIIVVGLGLIALGIFTAAARISVRQSKNRAPAGREHHTRGPRLRGRCREGEGQPRLLPQQPYRAAHDRIRQVIFWSCFTGVS